jgi:hypothetical protein
MKKGVRLTCSKCGIPTRDWAQLDKHMYVAHTKEKLMNDDLTMPSLAELIKEPTKWAPKPPPAYYPPSMTPLDTEQERIDVTTRLIKDTLGMMAVTGATKNGTAMLLELTQAREIMLANKEEIDGSR